MGDPDRLLNVTSDADDLERELLASVRNVGPPRGAKDEGWAGIAAQLTAVGAVGAAAHSAASAEAGAASATATKTGVGAAMSKAIVAKVVVALAIGGSTVGAGTWYMQHRSAAPVNPTLTANEPSRAAAPMLPAAPDEPVAPLPSPEPALALPSPKPIINAPAAPPEMAAATPSPKRVDNSPRPRESLDAESEMIAEARAELRGGDARASMATLERLRAQFPKGILAQEREVLSIEVLAALDDREGASRKARAFSDAHPNSPFTAKLRRFIIEP